MQRHTEIIEATAQMLPMNFMSSSILDHIEWSLYLVSVPELTVKKV